MLELLARSAVETDSVLGAMTVGHRCDVTHTCAVRPQPDQRRLVRVDEQGFPGNHRESLLVKGIPRGSPGNNPRRRTCTRRRSLWEMTSRGIPATSAADVRNTVHRRQPIAVTSKLTRKLCYRKDYRAMRLTAQSDNTHMVCCYRKSMCTI